VRRRLLLGLAALGVAGALTAGFGYGWTRGRLAPAGPSQGSVRTVVIPPGATTREVAELLHGAGLIRDPVVFRLYARFRGLDGRIQSGEYELSAGMSAEQILDQLVRGQVVERSITIPEGLTVAEVAQRLGEAGVVDPEEFLAAVAASTAADAWVPRDAPVRVRLEGYLFPATYRYRRGVTGTDLVAMMVERFRQVWTPEYEERARELGLTVHQVVTLASIVEEEAQVPEERPIIAGVYLNRLRLGMKLDADPTVRYALQKPPDQDLTLSDLQVDDPYNTYRYPGLPPGPICNPGEASIRAVLFPAEHDYLYFVARGDGSGRHRFSRTLEEHWQAMAEAKRERAAREAQAGAGGESQGGDGR